MRTKTKTIRVHVEDNGHFPEIEEDEAPARALIEYAYENGINYFDMYLLAQKRKGRIRHLGFSAHGRADTIDRFLQWKDCFEFAQLQLNHMDWDLQNAKGKYGVVTRHGIPVIVMEPVRGGSLAALPDAAAAPLKAARPDDSLASWALRFVQSLPNVKIVLSGMSNMAQLQENIRLFSQDGTMTGDEMTLLKNAVNTMVDLIPCTGCRYCCDACPQMLDIPKLLSLYNEVNYDNGLTLNFTLGAMRDTELPSACVACGACSALCPQGIDIPDIMRKFVATRSLT